MPTSIASTAREIEAVPATLARASEMRDFGDRPLVALTAGLGQPKRQFEAMGLTPEEGERVRLTFRAPHDDQATWSRCSLHVVVPNASHHIQFDRPDVVIATVRDVVTAVGARTCGSGMDVRDAARVVGAD